MKRLLLIALSVISAVTLCLALTACKEDGKTDIAYEKVYTITYDYDGDLMRGDESAAKSETVAFSDLSGFTLPTAIKRGYTFKRWLNGDEEFDLSALDETPNA